MLDSTFNQHDVTTRFVKLFYEFKKSGLIKNQTELANRLGFQRQSLHLILKGRRDIPIKFLFDFVNEFKIDPSYFFKVKAKDRNQVVFVPSKKREEYLDKSESESFIASLTVKPTDLNFQKQSTMSFEIKANDLAPTLQLGDWVYCKQLPVDLPLIVNKIYIFVTNEDIYVQRFISKNNSDSTISITDSSLMGKRTHLPMQKVKEVWEINALVRTAFSSEYGYDNRIGKIEKAITGLL